MCFPRPATSACNSLTRAASTALAVLIMAGPCLAVLHLACGQSRPGASSSGEPGSFEQISEQYELALQAWQSEIDSASPDDQARLEAARPKAADHAHALWRIIRQQPVAGEAHSGEVYEALVWIHKHVEDPAQMLEARRMLVSRFGDRAELSSFIESLYDHADADAAGTLAEIEQSSPHPTARAFACYIHAFWLLANRQDQPELAVQRYEHLVSTYADVALPGGGTVREDELVPQALAQARSMVRLAVGRVAPEIRGIDLDGVALKLSDYRGRVVMLDFWAHWCGGCMAMVPHERQLVKRLEEQPFALVGVNGDADPEAARRKNQELGITWRSFWNGPGGDEGPITSEWLPRGWPTIYLIDHDGVIRHKQVGRPGVDGNCSYEELDAFINQLVAEAASARTT